jgi:hypothetical protein
MTEEVAKTLKEQLEEDKQKRAETCSAKVQELLKEFDCRLEMAITITSAGNIPQLSIVAN